MKNAVTGVKLIDGGILYATNSEFKDNGVGVEYTPYSNTQQGQHRNHFGYVKNCTFLNSEADFKNALELEAFVLLNGIRGIRFSGCSFLNSRKINTPMGVTEYGYGIKATDSQFAVQSLQGSSTLDHTLFSGLGIGVYVGSAQEGSQNPPPFVNVPYTIKQAHFEGCFFGIHNRFVSLAVIVGNTFHLGNLPTVAPNNLPFVTSQYGLVVEQGTNGFVIEENQFVKEVGNVGTTYGTYCEDLGFYDNVIRKNIFSGLDYSIVADGVNSLLNPVIGLYYVCNKSTSKFFDFYTNPNGQIRVFQGEPSNQQHPLPEFFSAANEFTKQNAPYGDFRNHGTGIQYMFNQPSERPKFFKLITPNSNALENGCASNFCLPPCLPPNELKAMTSTFANLSLQYAVVESELEAAIEDHDSVKIEIKRIELSVIRGNMDKMAFSAALNLAYDTIGYSPDTIRNWWHHMNNPTAFLNLAREFFLHNDFEQSNAYLDRARAFLSANSLDGVEDVNAFSQIMHILDGKSARSLPDNKVQELISFTSGIGMSAAWAKNILTLHGYHFPPEPHQPELEEDTQERAVNGIRSEDSRWINVFPNPSNSHVQFAVNGAYSEESLVQVFDMDNKLVFTHTFAHGQSVEWNTANVPPGLYHFVCKDENGRREHGRIAVVKSN